MNKQIFYTMILCSFFLVACTDLSTGGDRGRRPDDRSGDPDPKLPTDLEESFSWKDLLKNCKPDLSVPDNTIDLVTDVLGLSDKYPPRVMRECFKKRLEDAHDRICDAREALERQRERARSDSERSRVESSIYKLDQIQFKFKENLYELAVDFDEKVIKLENKNPKNDIGRFINWIGQEEGEALRDILDTESYTECNFYSTDDD